MKNLKLQNEYLEARRLGFKKHNPLNDENVYVILYALDQITTFFKNKKIAFKLQVSKKTTFIKFTYEKHVYIIEFNNQEVSYHLNLKKEGHIYYLYNSSIFSNLITFEPLNLISILTKTNINQNNVNIYNKGVDISKTISFIEVKKFSEDNKSKLLNIINKNIDYLEINGVNIILGYLKDSNFQNVPLTYIYEVLLINEINKILELNKLSLNGNHEGNFDAIGVCQNTKFNFEFTLSKRKDYLNKKIEQFNKRKTSLNNNFKNINIFISPQSELECYDKSFNIDFNSNLNVINNSKYRSFVKFIKNETQYTVFDFIKFKIMELKSTVFSKLNENLLAKMIFE